MDDGSFTRKDYLNKVCTHREYYAQFVIPPTMHQVLWVIGGDDIRASTDRSFNDIRLERWDRATINLPVGGDIKAAGDYWTLAGLVCVAKEAARQWKESQ